MAVAVAESELGVGTMGRRRWPSPDVDGGHGRAAADKQ
jgi:hypothetical protein